VSIFTRELHKGLIGVLGMRFKLLTWNVGKQTPEKLHCISSLFEGNPNIIYVIGLQEIHSIDIPEIERYLASKKPEGYDYKMGRKPSSNMKMFQSSGEFDLVTFLVYPTTTFHSLFRYQRIALTKRSFSIKNLADTKGYLWVDLKILGVEITLVNIHLPFEDAEFSKINFTKLYEKFNSKSNLIIFGDYNSRSRVDDTCLEPTSTCEVSFKRNAEKSVSALEQLLNRCNSPDPQCEMIGKRLREYDYLNEVKHQTMPDWNESDIHFLPSYKINEAGHYRLQKHGDRRLAGYADRIFVKGNALEIVKGTYTKGRCLGNDHFPVQVEIEILDKKRKTRKNINDIRVP